MSENNLKTVMDTTMEKLRAMVDDDTIIGTPIVVGNVTLLPVSKVSFGLATGGSDFPSKTRNDLFGGGGGAGSGAGSGAAGSAGGEGGTAAAAAQANTPAEQRSPARSKRRENPLANVTYGRQSEPAKQTDAAAQDQTEQQDTAEIVYRIEYLMGSSDQD